MKARHQHSTREALDRDGLGVHRYVKNPLEESPDEERQEERPERTGEPDEWSRGAVAEQAEAHHLAASQPGQEAAGDSYRQDRADGSPEQGEAQPAVTEAKM